MPPWPVRAWLLWLVLACLLPGIVGVPLLFFQEYGHRRDELENHVALTARALAQTVDTQLLKAQSVAQALSTANSLHRGDFAAFHQRAKETAALAGTGINFILTDTAGRQLVNTLVEPGRPLPRHGSPEQIRQVVETGRPVISNLFVSGLLERPFITVDVPVLEDGKVIYVVSSGILPDQFAATLRAQALPGGWVAGIFDRAGTVVARTLSPDSSVGHPAGPELLARIRGSREGSLEHATREGIPVLSVFCRSAASDWTVVISVPIAAVEAGLVRSLAVLGTGMAVLFAVGLALAWFMGGRIARSVGALAGSARALGRGEAVPVPAVPIREVAEVARAMAEASRIISRDTRSLEEGNRSLVAREEELAESRARLVAILDSLREGVVVSDLEGAVINMNPAALRIHGYRDGAEARRRLPDFTDTFELREIGGPVIPVAEWPLARVLRGESFTGLEVELHRRGNGDVRIFDYSGTPVRDGSGETILAVLTIRDITDRKQAEDEVRRLNGELEHRVRQRTEELERSNEALLRSNMELQRFAHAAAHDLQTPLRSIAGFAQLLQGEIRGKVDDQADGWLALVIDNTRRLQVLIRELLAYSRLEALAHPFEPTDLGEVFRQVTGSLSALIEETGAEVESGELPTLRADRTQMAQLLQNLIENGIKYNRSSPPRVVVSAERLDGEWLLSVVDNGLGIDARHHRRIFEIFRRLHSYGTIPGTGIGLAICLRIVERHGGRIWVESESGQGSAFRFTLPDRQPDG